MKRVKHIILFIIGATISLNAFGQKLIAAPEIPPVKYIMNYTVVDGDTIFLDELDPIYIHPKNTMSKKEWKKYYKTVYNFSRAYPYALFVSDVINRTDSLFNVDNYTKFQQERYLEKMKENLLADFTDIFKGLTLKQGLMMIRLIDREVGMTPYYIIKDYLGGANALFWQGVAKMFKGNLKKPFDKYGETDNKWQWVYFHNYKPLDEEDLEEWYKILREEKITEKDMINAFTVAANDGDISE
mgnify:CR=1 FL=1